jgi:hypothetical protein
VTQKMVQVQYYLKTSVDLGTYRATSQIKNFDFERKEEA